MNRTLRMFAALTLTALLASPAFAAPINYGDFSGDEVDYLQVTENSVTDPGVLYGEPAVFDNSLVFTPFGFAAYSSGGGIDITDGHLTTVVMATGGAPITQVKLHEFGDYTLSGIGTAATKASVANPVFLTILQVDNADIAPIAMAANAVVTPSGGSFDLIADPGVGVIWEGNILFDVPAILAAHSISGNATKARLTMNNTLIAASEANTVAFIQKKGVIITVSVPEPSTVVMSVMGLVALVGYAVRRRRTAK